MVFGRQRFRVDLLRIKSIPSVFGQHISLGLFTRVFFYISRLNMQSSRTSASRITPIEQFTGRKIDAARDFRVQLGDYVQATVRNTNKTQTISLKETILGASKSLKACSRWCVCSLIGALGDTRWSLGAAVSLSLSANSSNAIAKSSANWSVPVCPSM